MIKSILFPQPVLQVLAGADVPKRFQHKGIAEPMWPKLNKIKSPLYKLTFIAFSAFIK